MTNQKQGGKAPENTFEIPPNPKKLIQALRQLDYSSSSAICDILDNSIDAQATNIHVVVKAESAKNIQTISIWDDGVGMDKKTLVEAIKLGSDTEKDNSTELGWYGMGLTTASMSVGLRLHVASLKDGKLFRVVYDLEEIAQKNKFAVTCKEIVGLEKTKFVTLLQEKCGSEAKSGTYVSLRKIDRWKWVLLSATEKNLSTTIAQTYRKFISNDENSNVNVFMNGNRVEAIDPIHDNEPNLLVKENITVDGEFIEVRIFELNDFGEQINKNRGIGLASQGFSVFRNNRELSSGETFGLWKKHNRYNRLRGEISFNGTLDAKLNSGFTKQSVNFDQSVLDKLKPIINPHLKYVGNRQRRKEQDLRDTKEDFSNIEKFVLSKANLLRNSSKKIEFRTVKLDKTGVLFRAEKEKDTTILEWNIDHPFYEGFVLPHISDPDIINPVAYLIYSLATAELTASTDSQLGILIDNIKMDYSRDLKVLMS